MGNELNIDEELQPDWLDAKLRDEMPYLDDAGFTAQVMQKLPARRRSSRSMRAVILLGAALIASIVSFLVAGSYVADAAAFIVAVPLRVLVPLGLCATMLVMIGGTALALSKAREARL
ncbi:MAG: hypothetical protein M3Y86_11465 [Verrucomicrobiota bacterium]|nr:hypothetical protein [Verrucomicrobiota bacterium]